MDRIEYDVVILGSGPAGLQAAVHAARKKVQVLLLGKMEKSSLFGAHVENYLSMDKTTGKELLDSGREQATGFGVDMLDEDAVRIEPADKGLYIFLESGKRVSCFSLIIATGSRRNHLGVPGEKKLLGKGVSYCVDCDGNFFR